MTGQAIHRSGNFVVKCDDIPGNHYVARRTLSRIVTFRFNHIVAGNTIICLRSNMIEINIRPGIRLMAKLTFSTVMGDWAF